MAECGGVGFADPALSPTPQLALRFHVASVCGLAKSQVKEPLPVLCSGHGGGEEAWLYFYMHHYDTGRPLINIANRNWEPNPPAAPRPATHSNVHEP